MVKQQQYICLKMELFLLKIGNINLNCKICMEIQYLYIYLEIILRFQINGNRVVKIINIFKILQNRMTINKKMKINKLKL